jgi:hypothetical protein
MSLPRYQNFLGAEQAFTNRYLPYAWRLMLWPRLWCRACKYLLISRNKEFSGPSWLAGWGQLLWLLTHPFWRRPVAARVS